MLILIKENRSDECAYPSPRVNLAQFDGLTGSRNHSRYPGLREYEW